MNCIICGVNEAKLTHCDDCEYKLAVASGQKKMADLVRLVRKLGWDVREIAWMRGYIVGVLSGCMMKATIEEGQYRLDWTGRFGSGILFLPNLESIEWAFPNA